MEGYVNCGILYLITYQLIVRASGTCIHIRPQTILNIHCNLHFSILKRVWNGTWQVESMSHCTEYM